MKLLRREYEAIRREIAEQQKAHIQVGLVGHMVGDRRAAESSHTGRSGRPYGGRSPSSSRLTYR